MFAGREREIQAIKGGSVVSRRIVLTGGGTLGHVTPHLALIPRLLETGYDIHYIGTENGMEAPKMRSVPGVTYHAVKSG